MAEKKEPFSRENLEAMAGSPAGQALLAALRQTDEAQLRRAMALAQSGDMNGAGAALGPILSDPRIRDLVRQLGGQ